VHELVILDSGGSQLDTRATRARVCMSVAVCTSVCVAVSSLSSSRVASRLAASRGPGGVLAKIRNIYKLFSYDTEH
jgi:hypothetical protein